MTNAPHEVYTFSPRISVTTRNFIQTARGSSTVTPARESCCDGFRWTRSHARACFVVGHAVDSTPQRNSRSKRRAKHARLCDGFRIDGFAKKILGFRGRLALNTLLYSDMSRAHQDEYYAVFSEPGALTSALKWYRTMQFGRSH